MRLASISIAPVKGMALVDLEEAWLGPAGVAGNRRFYLVDEAGRLVHRKRLSRLCQIVPSLEPGGRLRLAFPNGTVADAQVQADGPVTTNFFGRPVKGRRVVGPWSAALSAWAGQPLTLVQAEKDGGAVDRGPDAAVSLVSTGSLARLAEALARPESLDGRRFRMLFGVEGPDGHEEDGWIGRRVRIGESVVVPGGHVGRCLVTGQDPDTGDADLDTVGALRSYRRRAPTTEPLACGVWGSVVVPGWVRRGASVEVL